MYPLITCDLGKLRRNAVALKDACRARGVLFCAVTKCVCGEPAVAAALEDIADGFADSRITNLRRYVTDKPKMLLRIGDPQLAGDIAAHADLSLQSEEKTLRALSASARALQRLHRVVLMVDLGDLREGLMVRDRPAILRAARTARDAPGLSLEGIGTNLTCFGGILPDPENLGRLVELAEWLRQELDLPLPLVSGGNSSSLGLLLRGQMPRGITHLRIGEAMLLGNDTAAGAPFDFLSADVFTLSASLGEVQRKPSMPLGSRGPNAFGERVSFEDRGPMLRGIALIGRQDTDAEGLRPRDGRIRILGASSDHLVLDLTDAPGYSVGDPVHFGLSYGALLRAYTSPYVAKEWIPWERQPDSGSAARGD